MSDEGKCKCTVVSDWGSGVCSPMNKTQVNFTGRDHNKNNNKSMSVNISKNIVFAKKIATQRAN